ncbi:uncharacterized protein MONOS_8851 [Monocercomonoides exilis]|uniref:uncharacterized protein n=1 Tax=Monocercomonoides exilis TaxID=2049356 RepID=UPI003559E3E3|nr:hypothetical protein MONOS_8851 [Monocercomonoides exilis]|eukprot:MONOS_8851.1-p1 / transcript=MONOS_8851.1 / gene=MONOS_8851 / organism=Monocercomonoides_exilis_PA203 / gene_product=unspecified product / transcript_product=unspecified product / location=Mono_scaffold00346:1741-2113(+) / protein_length=77 / sequence_SO=supercontig / SO=protein_coding / is_pseudo=false
MELGVEVQMHLCWRKESGDKSKRSEKDGEEGRPCKRDGCGCGSQVDKRGAELADREAYILSAEYQLGTAEDDKVEA